MKIGHRKHAEFKDLVGKTFTNVERLQERASNWRERTLPYDSDAILFEGPVSFALGYYSDCCASCDVKQIDGDLSDLVGTPILSAEEVYADEPPVGEDYTHLDSWTWTFYHIRTIKGTVTIQFFGESNGYYSETATFEQVELQY